MKTKLLLLSLLTTVFSTQIYAQNRTSVNAMNVEISDNLDLRAVASIFGDSRDLQDFERRLNDPELQISNLDLNNDDEVDYLRVIESVENRTHLIIVQAVIDQDVYQDVATIDVERDNNNKVHVQVIGDVYMYGQNYIYEPVYYTTPVIYASFWRPTYRAYCSTWNWGYYPSYYRSWNPFPVFRYRNNINISLNIYNNYNYVSSRRSNRAVVLYTSRRSNGYERQNPNYSFSSRNATVTNRYELDRNRSSRNTNAYSTRRTSGTGDYLSNRSSSDSRTTSAQRNASRQDVFNTRGNSSRHELPQRAGSQRDFSQNRTSETPSAPTRQRSERNYSENTTIQESQPTVQRGNTNNRMYSERQATPQRDFSQNRKSEPQQNTSERSGQENRGNSPRESTSQRSENQRGNSSRNENRRS